VAKVKGKVKILLEIDRGLSSRDLRELSALCREGFTNNARRTVQFK